MSQLEAQLKQLRPSLFDVGPLEAQIILAYGVFNILIGPALALVPRSVVFLPNWVWGAIFTALGVWMVWALLTNNWHMSRLSLLVGILVKSIWLVALVLLSLVDHSWTVTLVWAAFAWIQILCYVYFPTGNGHVSK